jgi:hypothetical protein
MGDDDKIIANAQAEIDRAEALLRKTDRQAEIIRILNENRNDGQGPKQLGVKKEGSK